MFGFGCFEVAGFVSLLLHPVLINISCQPPSCQAVPIFPLLIFRIFLMLCLQLQTLSHDVEQIGWNVAVSWFWLDKNKIKDSFLSRSGLLSHALLKTLMEMKTYAVITVLGFYVHASPAHHEDQSRVLSWLQCGFLGRAEICCCPSSGVAGEGRVDMQMCSNVIIMYQCCRSAWRAQYIVWRTCGWMLK